VSGAATSDAARPRAASLHADALCFDAAAPVALPQDFVALTPELDAGGLDAVLATVASVASFREAADVLGGWHVLERSPSADFVIARSAAEVRRAHAGGKRAVVLHLQGGNPIENNVDLVDVFHGLGVRVVQITYNHGNLIDDGCLEEANGGLSAFGGRVIERLQELRVAIDVTHVGERTSLEAIELARGPVIASHSNARAICDSPRNLTDELIDTVAASGGVIGLCGFPTFVSDGDATLDGMLDHADYISERVGCAHVGLGLDFADEGDYIKYGYDPRYYPPPPWTYPAGIGSLAEWPNIASGLLARGYSEQDVRGILGENFLRVLGQIWGG
jgi:membrane dipeptidase